MTVRQGTPTDVPRALAIWRDAVDATHGFLTPEDRREIDRMGAEKFLPNAQLWLVDDRLGRAVGFLVMDGQMIDALFVDSSLHGQGYGTALLDHALTLAPGVTVEASEQASNALPFYEAKGFVRTGRSETDPQGRPYPLIQLKYVGGSASSEGQRLAGENQREAAAAHDHRAQQLRDIDLNGLSKGDCAGHAASVRRNP